MIITGCRRVWEHGGVFIIDEADASAPAVLILLNQALANGECAFDDAVVPQHEDFVCVATANTVGNGATRDYSARQRLDKATLDRFVNIAWQPDVDLEKRLATAAFKRFGGDESQLPVLNVWLADVSNARNFVDEYEVDALITPRAAIKGAKSLAAGGDYVMTRSALLTRHFNEDQRLSFERKYTVTLPKAA